MAVRRQALPKGRLMVVNSQGDLRTVPQPGPTSTHPGILLAFEEGFPVRESPGCPSPPLGLPGTLEGQFSPLTTGWTPMPGP